MVDSKLEGRALHPHKPERKRALENIWICIEHDTRWRLCAQFSLSPCQTVSLTAFIREFWTARLLEAATTAQALQDGRLVNSLVSSHPMAFCSPSRNLMRRNTPYSLDRQVATNVESYARSSFVPESQLSIVQTPTLTRGCSDTPFQSKIAKNSLDHRPDVRVTLADR